MTFIRIILELFDSEGLGLWVGSEPREKECKGGQIEEFVLSLLTVLVHRLPYSGKVHDRVLQELVVLVVSMRQHKKFDEFDELKAGLLGHFVKQAREFLVHKCNQRVNNIGFFLVTLPFVEEGLVCKLEEECHGSETRPLEEEVKVLIVVSISFLGSS